jgi:hypothetical protein
VRAESAHVSSGVLVLSHRGYSFIEDLAEVVRAQGREVYILSSRPAAPNRARDIAALSDWSLVTGADALVGADIDEALIALRALGKRVIACVSVWEGYRRAMAETNARLGATDVAPESVEAVQDKLLLRQRLVRHGLSRVHIEIVDAETLATAQRSGRAGFVKPRRGVASFGSRRLTPDLTLERLAEVRRQAAADADYAELMSCSPDFILEDYIDGPEYSFELVALEGKALLVGVHEKALEEAHGAMLETTCVSPPPTLSEAELTRAYELLAASLTALGLHTGIYHIEARHVGGERWEIIEINPRIGGSFINQSLKAQGAEHCLLAWWLRTLLARGIRARARLLDELNDRYARIVLGERSRRVFFRVYYGEPGRTVARIRPATTERPPSLVKIFIPDGTQLPHSSREVFLAQALWTLDADEPPTALEALRLASRTAMEIEYAS